MQREVGNKRGLARSLFHLAWMRFLSASDIISARAPLTEAEALFRESGDRWGMAESCQLLGQLTLQQGDVGRAYTLLEQSLTLFRELDYRRGIARALSHLGDVAAVQQNWARARPLYEASLTEAQEAGDKVETASCLAREAGPVADARASLANVQWAAHLLSAQKTLRETI